MSNYKPGFNFFDRKFVYFHFQDAKTHKEESIGVETRDFPGNRKAVIAFIQDFCNSETNAISFTRMGEDLRSDLKFTVNGKDHRIDHYHFDVTLSDMIRYCGGTKAILDAAISKRKNRLDLLLQQIPILQSQVLELRSRGHEEVAETLSTLTSTLENELNILKGMKGEQYQQHALPMIQKCQRMIIDNKKIFQTPRNDNYLKANIALGIIGLGLLYLAAVLINRVITGNYLFFNKTKTVRMIEQVEKFMKECEKDGEELAGDPFSPPLPSI